MKEFAWLLATEFSTNKFIEDFHHRYPGQTRTTCQSHHLKIHHLTSSLTCNIIGFHWLQPFLFQIKSMKTIANSFPNQERNPSAPFSLAFYFPNFKSKKCNVYFNQLSTALSRNTVEKMIQKQARITRPWRQTDPPYSHPPQAPFLLHSSPVPTPAPNLCTTPPRFQPLAL